MNSRFARVYSIANFTGIRKKTLDYMAGKEVGISKLAASYMLP